jgi:hypothetical protein
VVILPDRKVLYASFLATAAVVAEAMTSIRPVPGRRVTLMPGG